MSTNGSWDKRQWQLLTDVTSLKPDGSSEFKVSSSANLLGVGSHSYVSYAYSGTLISQVTYYQGNPNNGGTLVATVSYSYDGDGKVIAIERVSA